MLGPVLLESPDDAPADKRADHEGDERQRRRPPDEALGMGDRKPKKHDVAGHVGHEHMPQRQVAQRVHQPGDERQHHQGGGEQTVSVFLAGNQRASCFGKM